MSKLEVAFICKRCGKRVYAGELSYLHGLYTAGQCYPSRLCPYIIQTLPER